MVNAELVRQGYAVVSVCPPNVKYVDQLRAVQEAAQAERAGLWSGSAFECLPADHRAGRC
jgi:micrococcal nuclease